MTPHDRDRRFLAWLKSATPQQLAAAWLRATRDWHKIAISRETKRRLGK
jgi:hypothetical protein